MPVYQRAHAAAVGQSKGKPTHLCCVRADGLDVLPAAYVPPGLAQLETPASLDFLLIYFFRNL